VVPVDKLSVLQIEKEAFEELEDVIETKTAWVNFIDTGYFCPGSFINKHLI